MSVTVSAILPYPWSSGGGLANVLDEPDLWGRIVQDRNLRRMILDISRPIVRHSGRWLGRGVSPDDDGAFGEEVRALLGDPQRRALASQRLRGRLARAGRREDFGLPDLLGECIVLWLTGHREPGVARFVEDAITPTIIENRLNAARFDDLLRGHERASASLGVALMACAMAMLRPREGRLYAESLLACNAAYARLVVRYQDSADALEDGAYAPGLALPETPASAPRRPVEPRPRPARRTASRDGAVPASPAPVNPAPVPSNPTDVLSTLRAAIERATDELGQPGLTRELARLLTGDEQAERGLVTFSEAVRALARQCEAAGRPMRVPPGEVHATIAAWIDDIQYATMEAEEEGRRRREDEELAAALCERLAQMQEAVPHLGARELAALLRTLGASEPASERGRVVGALRGQEEVVSGAFAALAQLDFGLALEVFAAFQTVLQRQAVAGLRLEQFAQAAQQRRPLVPQLARTLFVAAVRGDRLADVADYLAAMPQGSSASATFCGACVRAASRGEPVGELIRELAAGAAASDGQVGRLLELVDVSPGMIGIYHRLRLLSQELFFRPLRADIVAHDVAGARRRWEEFGGIDDMVATCIYRYPNNGREIGDNHVEQTRRYLRNFAEALDEWERGGGNLRARPGLREVVEAWSKLAESDELVVQIRRVVEAAEDPLLPPADLGVRYFEDRDGRLCVGADLAIAPELVRSWILRCAGDDVPLAVHLADLVRLHIGAAGKRADAVLAMLRERQFAAALRAAEGDATLLSRVRLEIDSLRRGLEQRFAAPLREARAVRCLDAAIEDYLVDLDDAFAANDMSQAETWLSELESFLGERERERDPERRDALEFLAELGETEPLRRATREELLQRVADAREAHGECRWHVIALQAGERGAPEAMNGALRTLAAEIDRPRLWPEGGLAWELSEAITTFGRFVARQCGPYRSYDPEPVDRVATAAGPWIAEVLRTGLPRRDGVAPLLGLAAEVREFAPVRRVAELLSVGPAAAALRAVDAAGRRELAFERYVSGEYDACAVMLADDPDSQLLRSCAQVMALLYRGAPLDIDWHAMRTALGAARRGPGATTGLLARLTALDAIAEVFAGSADVTRVIDHLAAAGPAGYDVRRVRAVLFALSLYLRVCGNKPPTEAFSLAMVLPEQIFRVWARWRLGLDMTRVPSGRHVVWQMVEAVWERDTRGSRLRRPGPGDPFPSFRCFALFAQTDLLVRGGTGSAGVLEKSVDDLQAAFRVLRIRNDGAHALTRPADSQFEQYFGLIRRWLDQLYLACPLGDGPALRAEVAELLEPLPIET